MPWGHWKTTTFVAALRWDRVTASAVFDGPMDRECFLAYVEQVLAPTFKPGHIIVIGDRQECANFITNAGYRHQL